MLISPSFLRQQAEEERRKLASWADEMEELEAVEAEREAQERRKQATAASEGEEEEGEGESVESQLKKEEEKNEVLKAARQFMKSGARVRRANRGKVSSSVTEGDGHPEMPPSAT